MSDALYDVADAYASSVSGEELSGDEEAEVEFTLVRDVEGTGKFPLLLLLSVLCGTQRLFCMSVVRATYMVGFGYPPSPCRIIVPLRVGEELQDEAGRDDAGVENLDNLSDEQLLQLLPTPSDAEDESPEKKARSVGVRWDRPPPLVSGGRRQWTFGHKLYALTKLREVRSRPVLKGLQYTGQLDPPSKGGGSTGSLNQFKVGAR
jgi:hypothetical protein